MALGSAKVQQRFDNPRGILGDRLREGSIYRLPADHGHVMFPDDYFSDCYADSTKGRPTIAARVMATVMILQAFEGFSDREACDRLEVDVRRQAAAGVDIGCEAFHATALVGQRNRLRASPRPRRLFEDTRVVAKETGALKNRARVLDATPIFDAVATEATVTQLRASIRKVLAAQDQGSSPLAGTVRSVLVRDDDNATSGKPPCDWDDRAPREALVDALVIDALAALAALDGHEVPASATDAVELLALVAGQDVEQGDDGVFRIVRKVAKDRVISTVDPEARHGHKSRNRHFDGYKAHLSIDPDSEIIDEVVATAANTPDRDAASDLLAPLADEEDKPEVLGDSAYADGATRDALEARASRSPPSSRRSATPSGSSPRFNSTSISTGAPSPVRPERAMPPGTVADGRRSTATARRARCASPAPSHASVAPSPSIPTNSSCNGPEQSRTNPAGPSTIGPTDRSSNARSPTSQQGPRAAAGRGPEARPGSPPTSAPVSAQSTGPAWPSSDCSGTRPAG